MTTNTSTPAHCNHKTNGVCITANGNMKAACMTQAEVNARTLLGSDARVTFLGDTAVAHATFGEFQVWHRGFVRSLRASGKTLR
jgi:hypothetical protein